MNRRVLAAVGDLFFASKIRGTAEHLNVTAEFARTADSLFDAAKTETPSLIILDLHEERFDPFALVERLKQDTQLREVPVVGFFSHVRVELQQLAKDVGMDHIMPRSVFTQRLPEILTGRL